MSHKLFITSDISVDERLAEVAEKAPEAALLWPWLLTALDDWGRATAEPKRLKYAVFPAIGCVTPQAINEALTLFAQAGIIALYEVEGKPYFAVPADTWFKYQTHIRTEKRDSDKSRIPAPPAPPASPASSAPFSAQVRADARDIAQVRAGDDNSQPSPSPSPLSPCESGLSDAAAPHAHTRSHETRSSAALTPDIGGGGDPFIREETQATLTRWRSLSKKQRARLPSPDALLGVLQRHHLRGMSPSVLRSEIVKLEDEAAAAPARPLTLARLDNWLDRWHAPPPDVHVRREHGRASAIPMRPEPPAMVRARSEEEWWITPLNYVPDGPTTSSSAASGESTMRSSPNASKSSKSSKSRAAMAADTFTDITTADDNHDDCVADALRSPPASPQSPSMPYLVGQQAIGQTTRPALQVIAAS